MKRYVSALLVACTVLVLAVACQSTPRAQSAPPAASSKQADTGSVELSNGSVTRTLTIPDLLKLNVQEGWAGNKSSTGQITPPSRYRAVSVEDLCTLLGKLDASMAVNVLAKDGYAMTFSYDQVTKGTFTTFDPSTGDEITPTSKLVLALAFEQEGKPIPEETDGPLHLVIMSAQNDQLTDGHWAEKWVRKITVKPMGQEWALHNHGTMSELIDRGTFGTCADAQCHGVSWTDDKGLAWSGLPLWRLVGRVDDDKRHGEGAFNDDLARKGYGVQLRATDGYTVSLDSRRVLRNNNIMVAYLLDGKPLTDKDAPLRLVGPDVQTKEAMGGIAMMELVRGQPGSAAAGGAHAALAAPTKAAQVVAGGAPLTISGAVAQAQSLSLDDLKKVGLAKITAEHPMKGKGDYEGVRLSALLSLAKPRAEAKTLVFTAKDGYKTEVSLADATSCADCLVAVDAAGMLGTVMPGLPGQAWVKDLVQIEVK